LWGEAIKMTIKHEALRLFLAVTALILTAMLTTPNDVQDKIGIEKIPSGTRKVIITKKTNSYFFRKYKKNMAIASDARRKVGATD
jgi:hypothetical protein